MIDLRYCQRLPVWLQHNLHLSKGQVLDHEVAHHCRRYLDRSANLEEKALLGEYLNLTNGKNHYLIKVMPMSI
ncbi:hypothetical protein NQ314_014184 [Rhamnusium bicolor]|uniref:Uncharacterized protein n=1 Tax=Rhamnusium bicolor TaxID=1586634 RepID=A0AAV8X3L3_9CUCU|nr:hypothetical protein NQ314_014184 [Rhamnusium bicolor]